MQIVLSMVDSMGESLVKGEEGRVLAFVAHVLASSAPKSTSTSKSTSRKGKGREELLGEGGGGGLKSLRIVDSDDEDEDVGEEESDGLDSDDEVELPVDEDAEAVEGMFVGGGEGDEGSEKKDGEEGEGGGKLGLVGTAIGLLVAVLQGESINLVVEGSIEEGETPNRDAIRFVPLSLTFSRHFLFFLNSQRRPLSLNKSNSHTYPILPRTPPQLLDSLHPSSHSRSSSPHLRPRSYFLLRHRLLLQPHRSQNRSDQQDFRLLPSSSQTRSRSSRARSSSRTYHSTTTRPSSRSATTRTTFLQPSSHLLIRLKNDVSTRTIPPPTSSRASHPRRLPPKRSRSGLVRLPQRG